MLGHHPVQKLYPSAEGALSPWEDRGDKYLHTGTFAHPDTGDLLPGFHLTIALENTSGRARERLYAVKVEASSFALY